jgi:hypothetical protein
MSGVEIGEFGDVNFKVHSWARRFSRRDWRAGVGGGRELLGRVVSRSLGPVGMTVRVAGDMDLGGDPRIDLGGVPRVDLGGVSRVDGRRLGGSRGGGRSSLLDEGRSLLESLESLDRSCRRVGE